MLKIRVSRSLLFHWSSSLLLALQLILGGLQLFDALGLVYYPIDRGALATMSFDLGPSLTTPLIILFFLWVGWVAWSRHFRALVVPIAALGLYPFLNFDAVVSAVSLLAVMGGLWARRDLGRFLAAVFGLLGGLEATALLHWAFFFPLGLASPFQRLASVETGLFYLAAHLAPFLALAMIFLWVFKLLAILKGRKGGENRGFEMIDGKRSSKKAILLLSVSLLLGVTAAVYPYLPSVNPHNWSVGVDFPDYVKDAKIVEGDVSRAFNVSGGSRPLIYIFIYGFQKLFRLSAIDAVRYIPVILNPLLVFSVYFLSMEIFNDSWVASWSAFFTASGTQISVGMFSYFLANMLALSIVSLSLGLLFRATRLKNVVCLLLASAIGCLMVFTHPWTFDQYYAPALIMAGLVLYKARMSGGDYKNSVMIVLYLASIGLAEVLKIRIFHGLGAISASSVVVIRIPGLVELIKTNMIIFRLFYGGLMPAFILLGLALLGFYFLRWQSVPEIYFSVFMVVTSIIFLIGDMITMNRLIYNIPIGLFAAHGFTWISRRKMTNHFKNTFILFTILYMVVYFFRSFSNISYF